MLDPQRVDGPHAGRSARPGPSPPRRPRPRGRRAARRRARAGARRWPRARPGPRACRPTVSSPPRPIAASAAARPSRFHASGSSPARCSSTSDVDLVVEEPADGLGEVLVVEDLVALGVDRLALLVDDVVELDDALADVEVEALDARLGALDRVRHEPRLDGDVLLEPEPLHQAGDAVGGEALHEVVVERQVEARRAGVALAAGTAAQLVVDAAGVVALGADDVQAAGLDDPGVVLLGHRPSPRRGPRRRSPCPPRPG